MRGAFYRKGLAEIIGEANVGPVVTPTRTVADADQIDLGGRVVTFRAHGPAHTTSDLSMLDKNSGLLLPADLLFVKRAPSLDGSLLGWLKELDALKAMNVAKAIPGHGPLTVDFASASADLARYLMICATASGPRSRAMDRSSTPWRPSGNPKADIGRCSRIIINVMSPRPIRNSNGSRRS